jgi:hypothetical protein
LQYLVRSTKPNFSTTYTKFRQNILFVKKMFFSFGATASSGPPHSRDFKTTHNDKPHSVALLWMSDELVAQTHALDREVTGTGEKMFGNSARKKTYLRYLMMCERRKGMQ